MSQTLPYTLTRATDADEPFLKELFAEVRGMEFRHLPEAMVEQLMDMQFRAQRMSYAAQYPGAVDEIVWVNGERAGRWLVDVGAEEICLVDVALRGRYRGQGVGTALVEALRAKAEELGRRLVLQVRTGNRAARLYERMGFVAMGGDEVYTRMEWRGVVGAAAAVADESAEREPVEQSLTLRYFRTLVGKTVKVWTMAQPDRAAMAGVELVVASVEALPVPGLGTKVEAGDSFVIGLWGSVEETLPHETVEVVPPEGAPMALFVTPLGPEEGRMRYEVVFNRARVVVVD